MFETVSTFVADPSVAAAAFAVGVVATVMTCAAMPLALMAARKRLDAIDAAQAESAAFMAGEMKRIANAIAHQRAKDIGDALRQTKSTTQRRRAAIAAAPTDAPFVTQPLRKTIH